MKLTDQYIIPDSFIGAICVGQCLGLVQYKGCAFEKHKVRSSFFLSIFMYLVLRIQIQTGAVKTSICGCGYSFGTDRTNALYIIQ